MEVCLDIHKFAEILEGAGYEGALELIEDVLLPMAKERRVSLWSAAWNYSDQDEEQDTAPFQLFHALQGISRNDRRRLRKAGILSRA